MKKLRPVHLLILPLWLGVILTANVVFRPSQQLQIAPAPVAIQADQAATVLAEAVAIPTVSTDARGPSPESLKQLRALLRRRFPLVHQRLQLEPIGQSLLYTWEGSDPALAPGLLLAHQDVVPPEGEAGAWTHPPFQGAVQDGYIWGRGTLDDKNNLIALLLATERLLSQGYQPKRTLLFAFGHDEEVGGAGAKAIAEGLTQRDTHLAFVLDEGGSIVDGVLNGLAQPAALIGIAEKGYASIELTVRGEGGHSSMPPHSTAVGRLAKAVARLEARPMPATIAGPTAQLFDRLAPEMDLPMRVIMSNRWLLSGVVRRIMEKKPSANATLRTTAAATMFQGSVKDNVLPQQATAVVNYRLLPGDTIQDVVDHVRLAVHDDAVQIKLAEGFANEASPVSPAQGQGWDALERAIRQTWPEVVVAPYLTVGATDARSFTGLTDHVYRFSSAPLKAEDLARIHGNDERIAIEDFSKMIGFYVRFIEEASGS